MMAETEQTMREPWGSELDRASDMGEDFGKATMSSDLERATLGNTKEIEVNLSSATTRHRRSRGDRSSKAGSPHPQPAEGLPIP